MPAHPPGGCVQTLGSSSHTLLHIPPPLSLTDTVMFFRPRLMLPSSVSVFVFHSSYFDMLLFPVRTYCLLLFPVPACFAFPPCALFGFVKGVAGRARRGAGAVRHEEGTREARSANSGRGLQPVASRKACVVGLKKGRLHENTHTPVVSVNSVS